jgi:hypothetical protein
MMAYEVFKRTGVRVEEPTVAITPGGTIVFNAAASRILTRAGINAVLLLWDKSANKLAFKATSKKDRNAFAVSVAPGRSSGTVRAKSFLGYVGWQVKKRESLPATWNEKERMLEISLPSEFIAGTTLLAATKRKITLED